MALTVTHSTVVATADDGTSDVGSDEWNDAHTIAIATDLSPDASDGAALGTTTKMWSDLFLAAGGVVNWNDGALTLTESSGALLFKDSGTENLRIDTDGSVIANYANTPPDIFTRNGRFASVGDLNTAWHYVSWQTGANARGGGNLFVKTRGSDPGTNTTVADNDVLGFFAFVGATGSGAYGDAAFIQAEVDGTVGASDVPASIVFGTAEAGATFSTERVRIGPTGLVTIASTSGALKMSGYTDIVEMTTPSNPAANTARLYCADDGGTTKLFFRDSAGTETELGGGGGVTAPLDLTLDDATNADISTVLTLTHTTSGSPGNGIGAALNFVCETTAGNNEIGARVVAVASDTTSTSEDFDLRIYTMAGGATARESARFQSDGDLSVLTSLGVGALTDGSWTVALAPSYGDSGLYLASSKFIRWSGGATLFGVDDTGIARNAAGVVEINSATAGTYRDLRYRSTTSSGRHLDTVVTLTDAATVSLDASGGMVFKLTAAGNRTIDVPSNKPAAGQAQKIVIMHEASGADRTLSLTTGSSGAFRFGTDITALSATTNGLVDYIGCVYNVGDDRWDVVSYSKGY